MSRAAGRRATTRRGVPPHGRQRSTVRSPSPPARPTRPTDLLLALRGSGQALYVGLADGLTSSSPASPTAWSRRATRYLRMDGETPGRPDNPMGSRGQVVGSTATAPATLEGIARIELRRHRRCRSTDASSCTPRSPRATSTGATHPHFLLKEITEAPASFRKTLRGKLVERRRPARRCARRPRPCRPTCARRPRPTARSTGSIVDRPGHGRGRRPGARAARSREPTAATDLRVEADARHRAVGLRAAHRHERHARRRHQPVGHHHRHEPHRRPRAGRGARVIGDRQPPHSDLTDKSDGVLYTSDGRDVEMSVASTKAFYAQVAAGFLLAYAIADLVAATPARPSAAARCCARCATLPDAMEADARRRPAIAAAAQQLRAAEALLGHRRQRRQPHRGEELRIKLSELCYKAIACDATEDKKHIDLSSEPLILVCAAGPAGLERRRRGQGGGDLPGPQGDADRHRHRGRGALRRRPAGAHRAGGRPRSSPSCCRTMVGHLFGYEAALAIDAQAVPLRAGPGRDRGSGCRRPAARPTATACWPACGPTSSRSADRFFDGLRSGAYNGHLEAATAVRLASLFRYAVGMVPLDAYEWSTAGSARPCVLVEDLTAALTDGHRGAHPPDRRHQAPGQDGHRRHLPLRRGPAAGRRWCARRSTPARPATASATRPCAPSPGSTPPWTRSSATPATASRATSTPHEATITVVDRAASPATSRCAPSGTRSCGAPSTAWPPSARSPWRSAAATGAP